MTKRLIAFIFCVRVIFSFGQSSNKVFLLKKTLGSSIHKEVLLEKPSFLASGCSFFNVFKI